MLADFIPTENTTATKLSKLWCVDPETLKGWINKGCKRGKEIIYLDAVKIGGRYIISPNAARLFITPAENKSKAKPKVNPNDKVIQDCLDWISSEPQPRGKRK